MPHKDVRKAGDKIDYKSTPKHPKPKGKKGKR